MKIGYKLTAEAFGPNELICQAVLAEQVASSRWAVSGTAGAEPRVRSIKSS